MSSIADATRTAHVLELAELCTVARECGLRAELPTPYDTHPAAGQLRIGQQVLPLHLVANTATARRQLELVRREVLLSPHAEHYVVLKGFPEAELRLFRSKFDEVGTHRVTVGCPVRYAAWARARLGPLAHLAPASPVRRLMEDLLCVTRAASPAEKDPLTHEYQNSRIKKDFAYGQMGVQCAGTLFTHVKGAGAVKNLEGDMPSQKDGTDLAVASSYADDPAVAVEVKTESYASGRITLELHSCYREKDGHAPLARTPGWLTTSKADVLESLIWPTGDTLAVDFAQLKQWVESNPRGLVPELGGRYAKQDYYSWILLANMNDILQDIPGAVHIRLGDWLPTLYPGEFSKPSLVSSQRGRTLVPQRLTI